MIDIEKYRQYARSGEAFAVLFVKKYLKSADNSVWVSILSYDAYNAEALKFKTVECELVPRRTRPAFPPWRDFHSQSDYELACRSATWEAANYDIQRWDNAGRQGKQFLIRGVSYPKDKRRNGPPGSRLIVCKEPDKYFRDDAPPEIKALAANLNDRTDPLWAEALNWVRPEYGGPDRRTKSVLELAAELQERFYDDDDGYVFKIKSVTRVR